MKGKPGDRQRLTHILEAIDEIQRYTENVELKSFLENSMMRFACVKQIEIIGEAANYITPETKMFFSDLEWGQIIGMRHIFGPRVFWNRLRPYMASYIRRFAPIKREGHESNKCLQVITLI